MQTFRLNLVVTAVSLLLAACSGAASTAERPAESEPGATTTSRPVTSEALPAASDAARASGTPETTTPVLSTEAIPTATLPATCPLTPTDMLGPFYTPGAPVRDQVGTGYVLTGVVRSGNDCSPVPGAQLDFWMAGPQGEYGDEWRAVTFSAADGSYRFESHTPPGYSGRPPHIHILVSAAGYATLVTQHYPAPGGTQAVLDLVLSPAQ